MEYLPYIQKYVDARLFQISLTVVLVLAYFLSRKVTRRLIRKQAYKQDFHESRMVYINKLTNVLLVMLFITLIGVVWEISLSGLSVYFASIFTVVGVALFANWSILSNLTSSIILYFFFPYKIGSHVRVIDGDNSIEGEIVDIALFYVKIRQREKNKLVSFPNNLVIQKAIVLLD